MTRMSDSWIDKLESESTGMLNGMIIKDLISDLRDARRELAEVKAERDRLRLTLTESRIVIGVVENQIALAHVECGADCETDCPLDYVDALRKILNGDKEPIT